MRPCVFLSALILFAFILFPTMCPAVTAADEIKFENLTIEDGLSQSSVFAIQQDKPGGLGIGLSICRSIAEKHGGTIWAENLSEGGAAFFFKLPPVVIKDD